MIIKNICCIGAGYVGGPTMSVLAEKCPNIIINVVDLNQERVNSWNSNDLNNLPVYEPGLAEIVKNCRNKNLFFSNLIQEKIKEADMVFISVNTPTKKKGLGAGKASDLKWVEACARQVAQYSSGHTIVVEKSTLPVRTAEVIKSILKESKKQNIGEMPLKTFDVLSNPEFLSEGSAIKDLLIPDRVLIGGENNDAINSLCEIYKNWVPEEKILTTNIWSSELAKLTSNAFLAQRISSINSISALCEATGANVKEVARAIGSDSRIGSKFLNTGPGFGGSCFKKDILNLVYLSEFFGLPEVAAFWESVVNLNNWHQNRISKLITKKLFGTLSNKKIVILGFAFKANTNDTRESAAIQICKNLLEEDAYLVIHDSKVAYKQIEVDLEKKVLNSHLTNNDDSKISKGGNWNYTQDLSGIFNDADAVVILTEWDIYKSINWEVVSKFMRSPAWIFDTRSILSPIDIKKSNLNFWQIGDGLL
ncbi:nucleotide sugar dehydrogenase [Prochlorococcus marinus]|uniref:nucleotide sugar dehydrogenase n=1 Tax=Prochlorococcus marinus TaxID=1219 RepID=UPI001ADA905E|nr:nucleotide sugar dehydrogenase [Prochlorococcus marinus]MBO8219538.1 nucleotide sugar dehydrogenase [Prochlorococcus marinus CUG1416]MBW3051909.1 nucleotide sugar dehydrogenase [Prochlorococcus marinus str. MU1416]